MAKYKVEYPNGPAGDTDGMARRLESLGGSYDDDLDEITIDDGPKAPTAAYINALVGEYNGTATLVEPGRDEDSPERRY